MILPCGVDIFTHDLNTSPACLKVETSLKSSIIKSFHCAHVGPEKQINPEVLQKICFRSRQMFYALCTEKNVTLSNNRKVCATRLLD